MSNGNKFLLFLMSLIGFACLYTFRYELMIWIGKMLLLEAYAQM